MDQYELDDSVRWIGEQLEKNLAGELYRYIADMGGIFINPAEYENFSLTVIEAMACGLPTFASCHGGSLEVIVDGVSGFHIDPSNRNSSAELLLRFFQQCQNKEDYWSSISKAAINRVESQFTWQQHASQLVEISSIYNFWKKVINFNPLEKQRYLEILYGLQYRKLAKMLEKTLRHH